MIVVCIKNKDKENELTINRKYDAIQSISLGNCYNLINDLGSKENYFKNRFLPLYIVRQQRIDKILGK